MAETLKQYQQRVRQRLDELLPIFAHASIGDFSRNIKIPKQEDEFTDLYVGLQIMIEVVREQTKELQQLNEQLIRNLKERTTSLKQEQEESAKREAIFSSIGEGLIVTNKDGRVILINTRALKMLHYKSEDEVLGKAYFKIFELIDERGKRIPEHDWPLRRSLNHRKRIKTSDLWVRRGDSTTFPIILTTSPVMAGSQVLGAVDVFRDVTSEKAVERSKTEFVLLASHQLRTPLSVIKWYAQLLARRIKGLDRRQARYLREIDQGTNRMNDIIRVLLDVAQIESGLLKYEPITLDPAKFINQLLVELEPQLKSNQVRILRRFGTRLPKLHSDPKLLRIVLQNLLTNSIKYMDPGGRISISLISKPRGSQYNGVKVDVPSLAISLSDSGYGIPADQQAWVFSKMFRASNIKDKPVEGTGVGLFIAKSVVNFLGGHIWLNSAVGKGTTFYLVLPLRSGVK